LWSPDGLLSMKETRDLCISVLYAGTSRLCLSCSNEIWQSYLYCLSVLLGVLSFESCGHLMAFYLSDYAPKGHKEFDAPMSGA
jgi:hypothetical protein